MIAPSNILLAIVAVVVYYWIAAALSRAAQPLRKRLADIGEAFANDENTPARFRKQARYMLDHAFSMRGTLIPAIFVIPIFAIVYVVRARWLEEFDLDPKDLSGQARDEFMDMMSIHNIITLANHPILMPIVVMELVIFMLFAVIVRAVIKGVLPTSNIGKIFMVAIEEKSAGVSHRLRHLNTAWGV
jgi:hypothetical protein